MSVVLIVDDEYEMARILRDILQREGHQCLMTTDSAYAMTMLEHVLPDVLILDLVMPTPNGWDILRRARLLDPNMPVIILTALESGQVGFRAAKEGAFAYLTKNADSFRELSATVAQAVAWRDAHR